MPCLLVTTPFVYPPPIRGPGFRRHPFSKGSLSRPQINLLEVPALFSIFLSFFFSSFFLPQCLSDSGLSQNEESLMVKWQSSCRGSWKFTRSLTNCCGEKKLESDHRDVSHARLPCVSNEYTMRNKHFCCVLSWSGHDILKPRAVPALLLQRQIVHAEFPGEAPRLQKRSPSLTARLSAGTCTWEIQCHNLVLALISSRGKSYQTLPKPPDQLRDMLS